LFVHYLWPLAGGTSLKYLQEKPQLYHSSTSSGNLAQVAGGSLGEDEGE